MDLDSGRGEENNVSSPCSNMKSSGRGNRAGFFPMGGAEIS
jgi:hypothetical protein